LSKILISNTTVVTMSDNADILEVADILIEDGRIAGLGPAGSLDADGADVVDGRGRVALPGFVNAHTHAAMTLLRGYADDLPLTEWLETKIWPREAFLSEGDVYDGTMLAAAEMIRGGTTCFADMYFAADEIAAAVTDSGLRASVCGVILGTLPTIDEDLARAIDFVGRWNDPGNRITGAFGPHSLYTCGADVLERVATEAKRLGTLTHLHFLETAHERNDVTTFQERTPLHALTEAGLLETPVLAAHCVDLSDREIGVLQQAPFAAAHCPGSNLKLASGIAPAPDYLSRGLTTGLGTDGAASNNNLDMLEEARLAALIHKANRSDATVVTAYQALSMATRGGAAALRQGDRIGQLTPGFQADLILLDTTRPHMAPQHNIVANIVYSAGAADVTDTMVDGRWLMRDREIQSLNEREVIEKGAATAAALIGRS
jgi:5-methylthioadenosine/S-adenosylhomocysteine deaminase